MNRSVPVASRTTGRHRAASRPTLARRAAVATVAVGAPLVPGALLAAPAAHADTDWDALAQCESSGNWAANTGNGFSGGLQFTPSTWKAFGGTGQAQDASRAEQIAVAEKVKAAQGMKAWPVCSKKTGNTSNAPDSGGGDSGGVVTVSDHRAPKHRAPETRVAAAHSADPTYTVRDGDTLSSIAATHGMSWHALQDSNRQVVTDPNMIFPGQTLTMA